MYVLRPHILLRVLLSLLILMALLWASLSTTAPIAQVASAVHLAMPSEPLILQYPAPPAAPFG
jgi:hypothetical protein